MMDHCPGVCLSDILRKKRKLDVDTVRVYAAEIVLALEYLHSKNIIYRNLQPDSIFFDAKGHVMLTDFGLAKQSNADSLNYT